MKAEIEPLKAADVDAVYELLRGHHLPIDGLAEHLETTLVARDGVGRVLAAPGSNSMGVMPCCGRWRWLLAITVGTSVGISRWRRFSWRVHVACPPSTC